MKIKNLLTFKNIKAIVTVIFFVAVCMFAQNFYKCTVSYIANNYVDGMFMPTMIGAYVIPVICFLCYFCNYYVKRFNKVATFIVSPILLVASLFALVNIFMHIDVYASNNALGVYQALPSIILAFPYDAIVVHLVIVLSQVVNIFLAIKPNHKLAQYKEKLYSLNKVNINIFEYVLYAIIGILSLLMLGLCLGGGLKGFANIFSDIKYLFLLLWFVLPGINLVLLITKLEGKFKSKKAKVIYLASTIVINALFVLVFALLEKMYPNFLVYIGKPLLPITFSLSRRIELLLLIVTQGLFAFVTLVKLSITFIKK